MLACTFPARCNAPPPAATSAATSSRLFFNAVFCFFPFFFCRVSVRTALQEITWPRELYLNVLVCKALVPPALKGRPSSNASYGVESENLESETATASVTTEGEGDARVVHPATITPGVMNAGLEGGDAESGGVDGVNGSDHEIVDGEEGYDEGVGKEAADSDVSDEDESEEEGQREEEEETGERGGGCFVRIRNATTGCDLQVSRRDWLAGWL